MVQFPVDWATDVMPQITAFIGQPLIVGATTFVVTLALGTLAARAFIGIFFKRD